MRIKRGRPPIHHEQRNARKRFGRRLREARERAQMTQIELAEVVTRLLDRDADRRGRKQGLGVFKEALIRNAESAEQSMPAEYLPFLARALGITVVELLGDFVNMPMPRHVAANDEINDRIAA